MSLEQDFALNRNKEQFCDGCGKHCPLSAPGCGYGRKKAQEAGLSVSEGSEYHGKREGFDRGEGHEGRGGRRESFESGEGRESHSRREGFEHEEGHGRRAHEHDVGREGHGRREDFERGEGHEGHGRREGFYRDEGREYRGRRDFEHRGERPHHRPVDYQNTEDLTILLRGCGHYLFHRSHEIMRGGDRGRGRGVMGGSQQQVLSILSKNGPMAQKDLLEMLMIQPGSLSELLSKLEEKGLLNRKEDENDRRKVILTLTEEGQNAVAGSAGESDQEGEKDLFAVLNEEEKNSLKSLLKKLLGSWE